MLEHRSALDFRGPAHERRNECSSGLREKTMSFERHHANRNVDRNLARARDLRSEYVNACLSATVELIARPNLPDHAEEPIAQSGGQALSSRRS